MTSRATALAVSVIVSLACAPASPPVPAALPAAASAMPSTDHPPADLKSDTLVRCLIDSPDGCAGCDKGDTCVYKQMKEYDCVYIVYGTKCE